MSVRHQFVYCCTILLIAMGVRQALAGEITQHFPVKAPKAKMRTAWRIDWGITRHAAGSEILYIKSAWFKRGPNEPEVQVLGDCRLAECFVPYNDGGRIYDIAGYNFDLEEVKPKDLGPVCVGPPQIFDRKGAAIDLDLPKGKRRRKGLVALEFHDDSLRWRSSSGLSRRGEEMQLWCVLDASNYRYIIMYAFRDDGQIGFRLGATAHNLESTKEDTAAHVHTACWRLTVPLGKAGNNDVEVVRYISKKGSAKAKTVVEPFNGGKEGGIVWNPAEFTRLRIRSRTLLNRHKPARNIAYEILSSRGGNTRQYGKGEEFTHKDFWVTRDTPNKKEMRYQDVPSFANAEPLNGPVVIWHQCSVLHTPRDEDFGPEGYDANLGVALTSWACFSLRPRNFFASTPLYP